MPEVDVAAADAHRGHLHQHLIRADRRLRHFLHCHVAGLTAVFDYCTHRTPSVERRIENRENRDYEIMRL
jgi:hypothetical protein